MRHAKKYQIMILAILSVLGIPLLGIGSLGCGKTTSSDAVTSTQGPTQGSPYTIVNFRRSASEHYNADINTLPTPQLDPAEGDQFHTGKQLPKDPLLGQSAPQGGGQ